jgi:hypothetical protein
MSTIYDDASLILYPSGYKASKLYSLKPTDGSGDLDVVRATTATRVNSDGLIEEVAINVPRIDYTGGGCGSLLLEPQRTNLFNFSEQFDNAYWDKFSATITANTAISPDGNLNADTINGAGRIDKNIAATGTMTFSVFAKSGTGSVIRLNVFDNVTDRGSSFNLSTGVAFNTYGSPSVSVVNYGNGWYRLIMTTTNAATSNCQIHMDTATTAFIWGAQLEQGSYPTSYIPTVAAAVTRNADQVNKTGISSLIGQTEGTLFADFTYNGAEDSGEFERIIAIGDGTANNRIVALIRNSTSQLNLVSTNGGVSQVSTGAIAGTSVIGTHKLAVAYKVNDYVCYLDGVQVFEQASGSVPAVGNFYLGRNEISDSQQLGGTINQSLLFPTRLTNSELETLTTL